MNKGPGWVRIVKKLGLKFRDNVPLKGCSLKTIRHLQNVIFAKPVLLVLAKYIPTIDK